MTPDVNVWPAQLVDVKPKPLVVTVVFCWSTVGTLSSVTSPGLVVRSTFVPTPVWKSACVVSVGQALAAAVASEKFCVVVLASVTTMPVAEPGA